VRETTIDHEFGAYGLPGPYLIKLDMHGYEAPIRYGATETSIMAETRLGKKFEISPPPEFPTRRI
jgi:hypothetical protein